MKKIFALIAVMLVSITMLASCDGFFGGGNGDPTGPVAPEDYKKIIYADEKLDLSSVRTAVSEIVGPGVTMNLHTDVAQSRGEIVFGETNRPITLAAKSELEKEFNNSENDDLGYIIYTDGISIAVYWNDAGMETIAINAFINEVVKANRLDVKSGTVAYSGYEKSEFNKNKYWLALESEVDDSVVSAIRTLYNYFDGRKMVGWMANLYDPERGGFYYSNSARDTAGYYPDIESTSQLIGTLISIGVSSNRNELFPNAIKEKIVGFAKSLQSHEDGYFYHPQWPYGKENLNTDRYGRDLGNATNVITSFKLDTDGDGVADAAQYPNWCAPNGVKCALHTGTNEKCSFPQTVSSYSDAIEGSVTTNLATGVSAAVSKLSSSSFSVKAVVDQHPDFSSRTAFSKWLEAYNEKILINSGNAHNLSALLSQITQQGYSDIVLDHLDKNLKISFEQQSLYTDEPTGLWQSDINYRLVWSLLKYATFYNNGNNGRAFPKEYVPYAVKSCIKVTALEPDGAYYMNDLYNQWTSIQSLINNVNKYYEAEYGVTERDNTLQTIYSIVRENAADLVNNSLKKIEPFKMKDGSFAYQSNGKSMTTIYGTPIAMGVTEGDVNAVALVTGMYKAIFTCLGVKNAVPLCTSDDAEYFVSELLACEPLDKEEVTIDEIDFESGIPTTVTSSLKTSDAQLTLAEDPKDPGNQVLSFTAGSSTTEGDRLQFKPYSHGSSCYIFETDIYVSSDTQNGYIYQINFGSGVICYMIALHKSENTVTYKEAPSADHQNNQQTRFTFSTDSWHRIRVEFYVEGEANGISVPNIKLWLDGEYIGVSQNYYNFDTGLIKSWNYNKVEFYAMKIPRSHIYLDNCFFSTDDKAFDPDSRDITDVRDGIDN